MLFNSNGEDRTARELVLLLSVPVWPQSRPAITNGGKKTKKDNSGKRKANDSSLEPHHKRAKTAPD